MGDAMSGATKTDTKLAILDAAERCFAEQGFEAATLRAITHAAGANVAAVNYHFGSKEGLLRALIERRLGPVNVERWARLEAAEKAAERAGEMAPSVEAIFEALIGPAVDAAYCPGGFGESFLRFMGRLHADSSPAIETAFKEIFGDVLMRFFAALERALPNLPREEIFWRMHFAMGAFLHAVLSPQRLACMSAGECGEGTSMALRQRLVTFMAAGMQAPHPPPP